MERFLSLSLNLLSARKHLTFFVLYFIPFVDIDLDFGAKKRVDGRCHYENYEGSSEPYRVPESELGIPSI